MQVNSWITCSTGAFGKDPYEGYSKACWCSTSTLSLGSSVLGYAPYPNGTYVGSFNDALYKELLLLKYFPDQPAADYQYWNWRTPYSKVDNYQMLQLNPNPDPNY